MSTLLSVTVSSIPTNPFILTGQTQQFSATAHYDTGDVVITNLSGTAWAALDPVTNLTSSVATINTFPAANPGLATALSQSGSVLITATYGGFTGTATLIVGQAYYRQIIEPSVEATKDGAAFGETNTNAKHLPISKPAVARMSQFGGVALQNGAGTESGTTPIGFTYASAHPGDYARLYTANEALVPGNLVQINSAGKATLTFASGQKNLGIVVSSNAVAAGDPVLVQIAGEAFVKTNGNAIAVGAFVEAAGPSGVGIVNGTVRSSSATISSPTPIVGYALETAGNTFANMVLIRIQILG